MQQRDDLYIFAEINHHHVKYWAWTGKLCPNFRKHGIVFRIRHRDDDSYDICIIDGCSHHIITNKSNVKVQKELKTFIDKFYDEGIQERQLDALESIQGKLSEIQSDINEAKYQESLVNISDKLNDIQNEVQRTKYKDMMSGFSKQMSEIQSQLSSVIAGGCSVRVING